MPEPMKPYYVPGGGLAQTQEEVDRLKKEVQERPRGFRKVLLEHRKQRQQRGHR